MSALPDNNDATGKVGNNTFKEATNIAALTKIGVSASIHSATDVDYYKIVIDSTGRDSNFFRINFTDADGDLDLLLYDAEGNYLSSSETEGSDSEIIHFTGLSSGIYYVKVQGNTGDVNNYTLDWDRTSYAPVPDNNDASGKIGNNTFKDATNIAALTKNGVSASIHSATDVDYYKIDLENIGMSRNFVEINFDNTLGNLDLILYDAQGNEVSSSTSLTDSREYISLDGLMPGSYYIKVYGAEQVQNTYSLSWDRTNYGPAQIDADDSQKLNDSISTATSLTAVSGIKKDRSIHTILDTDYYKINLAKTGISGNFVEISFDNALGNLDIHLYDAQGNEVASSTSLTDDSEYISLNGLAKGTYYIKIYGIDHAQNTYTLSWNKNNISSLTQDLFESSGGDTIATAVSPFNGAYGYGTGYTNIHNSTDVDYYKVVMTGPGVRGNHITLTDINATGRLDVTLVDAQGNVLRTANQDSTSAKINLRGLAAGTYYVRVTGENGAIGTHNISYNRNSMADIYEGSKRNNSIATAAVFPGRIYTHTNATNIQSSTDVDYFKINLCCRGTSQNHFTMNAINANGTLRATLVDAAGNDLRSSVAWSSDSQKLDLQGLAAGTYYIKVSGDAGAVGTYNFSVNTWGYLQTQNQRENPGRWDADRLEGNEDIASAVTVLGRSGTLNRLNIHSADDVDYYRVSLSSAGVAANYLQIEFNQSWGKLDMTLLDKTGNVVRTATASTDKRYISLEGLDSDTYYLKIQGVNSKQNNYNLSWNRTDASAILPGMDDAVDLGVSGNLNGQTVDENAHTGWYAFALNAVGTAENYITVNSDQRLTISVLDTAGRTIYTTTSRNKINLSGLASGRYYLKIAASHTTDVSNVAQYSLSYDLTTSTATEKVVGSEYGSLFAVNANQYAYLMGYGNVFMDDFSTWSQTGVRYTDTDNIYYDAEKCTSDGRDDYQCWAATASNMLAWTGWGEQGLSSATGDTAEDTLFNKYNAAFPDQGNDVASGIAWFFNGKANQLYSGQLTPTSGSGNYLGFAAYPGMLSQSLTSVSSLNFLADALHANMGVGLSLKGSINHAVTVWGYSYNVNKNKGEAGYYTGLLITDSDDNKGRELATDAPDRLNMISISWNSSQQRYVTSYGGGSNYLESFVALDHMDNWPNEATSTILADAGDSGTIVTGVSLDDMLAGALAPTADTLMASAELSHESENKNRQQGMLTA